MATKRDYYEILGITKGTDQAAIKAAYRKMALKWHPDRNKDNKADAETKFKEINEAYQVLSDPGKKQQYDPFTWSYQTGGENPFGQGDMNDPFEIFEQFFGGGGFGGGSRRQRYSLTIEFLEAVKGASKEVTIEGKKHTIKVPAGSNDGTRIRFPEFDITIDVKPDSRYKREGYDLFIDHKISFTLAALGGATEVPTIENTLKLKIRAGTQSHTLVRLRGEGVSHLQSSGKGDLYVRLVVEVPEKITKEQKKLMDQLKAAGI